MLKKTIQYKDLDGNTLVEDFYFNLTKAELAETDLVDGADSMRTLLEKLIAEKENRKILALFKELLSSTVGRRSTDGKRFIKNDEARSAFMDSEAYSEVIMEFFSNADSVVEFFKAVVPEEVRNSVPKELPKNFDELAKMQMQKPVETAELPSEDESNGATPEVIEKQKTLAEYTDDELKALPIELFKRLMGTNWDNLPKRVLVIAMQRQVLGS